MKIAIYVRCSTADQSLDVQRSELLAYAESRKWQVIHVYEDHGISGSTENRPQLRQLMKDAQARRFDLVLVWKLDRFARSLKNLLNSIQVFEELGIAFVSLKDSVDLSTSTGRLMLSIIGAFAQFERDIICERVNAGLRAAKAKGVRLGRPSTINKAECERLRAKGLSLSRIAKKLGCSKAGVLKTLKKIAS